MYFLYSVLLTAGFLLLLPRFLLDAVRHGKYAVGFGERTGSLPRFDSGGRPVIWLHCVSVGEAQAARPLARALLEQFPSHSIVVSTTTQTGQRVAREAFAGVALSVFYFPFDWAWSVRRALNTINPSVVLVMETELWPRFFGECRKRGIPIALVNGRISESSFRRYRYVRPFISRVLSELELAVMQSDTDAARIRSLGLASERVKISGNVKFDLETDPAWQPLTDELRRRFQFGDGRPLVLAASTHSPEEQIVIEAFKRLRRSATHPPRLLIAPRHPERFAEVAALLDASGLAWLRRTSEAGAVDASCDAVLLDTIGELRAAYPLADVVFVGGSIAPVGGHNVIEPAASARCIVVGAHTSNFKTVVNSFRERDALIQLPELDERDATSALSKMFGELLSDEKRRRLIGERARAVLDENRGATARTIGLLAPLLEGSATNDARRVGVKRELTSDI